MKRGYNSFENRNRRRKVALDNWKLRPKREDENEASYKTYVERKNKELDTLKALTK